MNNIYLKTDNDVKMELYDRKPKDFNTNRTKDIEQKNPRYGSTVSLTTNKVTDQNDKYLTRDRTKNIDSEQTKYKVTRLNIDSRHRNIDPQNIISKYIELNSYFNFTKDSNIIKIDLPKISNIFHINDIITITNIKPIQIAQRPNTLTLKKNSKYLYINHQNHGFVGTTNYIEISEIKDSGFWGNIPISIINKVHNIILVDSDNYTVDLTIYSNVDYQYSADIYYINILTYAGIHIKYLNASYPITNDVQQGYHTIIESTNNYIKIKLSSKATKDEQIKFNSGIQLGIISSIINGYPNTDHYRYELKKIYNKVKKIRLVSTEIPNTETLIKTSNCKLYWQILEDGDIKYSINITPGNYDPSSLEQEIISKVSNVDRVFGDYLDKKLYYNRCIPNITINPNSNIFSFQILNQINLSKNLILNLDTYDDGYKRLNIIHPNHNLKESNVIKIDDAIGVLDTVIGNNSYYVPNNVINSYHTIETVDGINSYTVKLPKYNPVLDNTIDSNLINGGNAVKIKYPLLIRLLFNYSDTFGSVLGFLNCGDETSITPYGYSILNSTLYENSTNLNSVGQINTNIPMLNFRTYPYILMVSELFSTTINYRVTSGVFAKLFLVGNPGSMIYDQYIQIEDTLIEAAQNLNELEFRFITPNGNSYNFNDQDHSYTIEIYEEHD
jgi:hypothetical protein